METVEYNKLVRDRIPEIIASSGKTCETEILSDEEYLRMVDAKLDEELAEYHQDQSLEELADLLEVIRAATVARGYTLEELEQVRADKALERGGFEKKILLKSVTEKRSGVHAPKQPRWELEEAVALMSLYIEKDGHVPVESVEHFSAVCRKRAEKMNISVDDRYRNVTGIQMQLSCIEYIFSDGKNGLSNVSRLFYQAYDLYRIEPEYFNEIAREFARKYSV